MKVIITGSSGMVGKGVLLECLDNDLITQVLVVNRNTIGMDHPKLKEVLLTDFTEARSIKSHLAGYDACFYCAGISVLGLNEEQYTRITYEMTKAFADVLYELNPNLVFNYVSGTGTDETEKGGTMWARVKGKTENMVLQKGFKDAYAFRPGAIIPERGIKSRTGWYNAFYVVLRPFFSIMKKSRNITTTTKIGDAMINSLRFPMTLKHLENPQINELATKS
ncbi:NAD-dependent epimerase/dehydratase family protein [Pontibacter sp. G13]|uniref:NAD-dependent epimerase/dehydratase family protein n=1 Tax=Pontibacter sp. G13 TaxID=3074898 RepID=UPI00288AC749|nr:NAD-dependent epimerase/dehydratase family protein [Pontibacter sp. G13]WNJ19361.1 NAD-dependent epimerase/dehydratase family protein [Pontibacter sp. G13]